MIALFRDDYDYAAALEAELNDPDTVEVEVEFDRGFDYDDSGIDVERGPEGEMPTSSDHQYTAINNVSHSIASMLQQNALALSF